MKRKYKDRNCEDCGIFFTPSVPYQKFCGSRTLKIGCSYKQTVMRNKRYGKKFREKNIDYYKDKPVENRNNLLKYKYKLTIEEYNKMLEKQDNVCAICLLDEQGLNNSGKKKRLAIDHNHETGEVRGLLCTKCNMALGRFDDSIEKIERALNYLKKYEI